MSIALTGAAVVRSREGCTKYMTCYGSEGCRHIRSTSKSSRMDISTGDWTNGREEAHIGITVTCDIFYDRYALHLFNCSRRYYDNFCLHWRHRLPMSPEKRRWLGVLGRSRMSRTKRPIVSEVSIRFPATTAIIATSLHCTTNSHRDLTRNHPCSKTWLSPAMYGAALRTLFATSTHPMALMRLLSQTHQ